VKHVFERLCNGYNALAGVLKTTLGRDFMAAEGLGFLSPDLSKLGTGMKVSVTLDLPGYTKEGLAALKSRCEHLNLDFSGAQGGVTTGATFDIFNKYTMGKTEVELVQHVLDGINFIYAEDVELQRKHGLTAV